MLSFNTNTKVWAFIFLLNHTLFFNFIANTIPLHIALIIEISLCLFFYLQFEPYKVNKFLFISLIISLISFFIGLLQGWYLFDIIGDTVRFIAPFFGFAVGLKLLSKLDLDHLNFLVKVILYISFITVVFSIIEILRIYIDNNQTFFSYTERTSLNVPYVLFLYSYLFFILRPLNKNYLLTIIIIFPVFIVSLLIDLSKINFIILFLFLVIPLFFYKKHILNFIITFVILVILFFSYNLLHERLRPMYETIHSYLFLSTISGTDTSTQSRIIETSFSFKELSESPHTYVTGYGNGALLFGITSKDTGIAKENFRDNGGLHHIHIEYILLLYRNGIIGLLFYLTWSLYIIWRSFGSILKYNNKMIRISVFNISIGILFFAFTIKSFTNAAFYGNVFFGLMGSLAIVLSNFIHKSQK